ncbi:MAG: AAA family ATPase [Mycoplasmataceae bacterium]|nr:AAA family ATPase [Mycoplasmataceae bacterium]
MRELLRENYLQELLHWKNDRFIKVLTGIRRRGKSTILNQYKELLIRDFNIKKEQIIEYDFNDPNKQNISYLDLYNEIVKKANKDLTYYVFLDEIQEIYKWERCVIGLFENKKIRFDVYITGSNSKLLSTELSTLLTGRHKDFHIFPISFQQMSDFFKKESELFFNLYLCNGGLGMSVDKYFDNTKLEPTLHDVFENTINQDVKYRHNIKSHN